jgi:hypothetical protein
MPGPISVKQALELFDTLEADPESGKLHFACFSGSGETAGLLISAVRGQGSFAGCAGSLTLDGDTVQAALRKAGGEPDRRTATAIVVTDMLERAECKCMSRAGCAGKRLLLRRRSEPFGNAAAKNARPRAVVLDRCGAVC